MRGQIPRVFPKKRFQAATVGAIDAHAQAIQALHEKLQQQGEVIADLCVARDEAKAAAWDLQTDQPFSELVRQRLASLETSVGTPIRLHDIQRDADVSLESFFTRFRDVEAQVSARNDGSFWQRLRWLVTGR